MAFIRGPRRSLLYRRPVVAAGGGGTVTFDNAALGSVRSSGAAQGFTVGSGSNRALVVGIVQANGTVDAPSGVTFNGVAMTLIGGTTPYIYGLVNPASGAHDI